MQCIVTVLVTSDVFITKGLLASALWKIWGCNVAFEVHCTLNNVILKAIQFCANFQKWNKNAASNFLKGTGILFFPLE